MARTHTRTCTRTTHKNYNAVSLLQTFHNSSRFMWPISPFTESIVPRCLFIVVQGRVSHALCLLASWRKKNNSLWSVGREGHLWTCFASRATVWVALGRSGAFRPSLWGSKLETQTWYHWRMSGLLLGWLEIRRAGVYRCRSFFWSYFMQWSLCPTLGVAQHFKRRPILSLSILCSLCGKISGLILALFVL